MTNSKLTTAGDAAQNFDPPKSVKELGGILGLDLSNFPFDLWIASLDQTSGIQCAALLDLVSLGIQIHINLNINPSNPPAYTLGVGDLTLTPQPGSNPTVYSAALGGGQQVSLETLFDLLGVDVDVSLTQKTATVTSLFMAAPTGTVTQTLFGLELDLKDLNATVSSSLLEFTTGSRSVSLLGGTFLLATSPWAAKDMTSLSGIVKPTLAFPSQLASGPTATATLQMKDQVRVPLTPSGSPPADKSGGGGGDFMALARKAAAGRGEADDGGDGSPKVHWLNVQKEVGPLSVERVGFAYSHPDGEKPQVAVLCDAKLTLGPLELSLDGFTVEFPLSTSPEVEVSLEGMDLAFSKPPLVIAGGFLYDKDNDLYAGEAMIESPALGLAALGEYADLKDKDNGTGPKSLALFAALTNPPIGGQPFLYVKGLALGFGYNNKLNIPTTIEELLDFYLLQVAAGTVNSPGLDDFVKDVTPTAGDNWIAIGLGLESFELVQATVMLAATFGHDLQFAILGQAELSIPPDSPERIAYAQVDVEATYAPAQGALEVFGGLTKNSFVLSPDCHISGGFAYILDVSSGDFVKTFGGYAPSFDYAQKGYPAVDRLEISWSVDSHTAIKGDAYYALTPAAMMAGGSLLATWDASIFSASFTTDVDLLMQWRPFAYAASFAMSLDVSFTLKVAFVHHKFHFHVGASLSVAGPPFHGRAHIHLSVISFTISFGRSPENNQKLAWPDFRKLLPGSSTDDANNSPLLGAKVTSGLIADLTQSKKGSGPDWVMSGTDFSITIHSSIPVTKAGSDTVTLTPDALTIGILPMSIGSADGALNVKLSGNGGTVIAKSAQTDATWPVLVEKLPGTIATAHWGTPGSIDINATPSGTCGYRIYGGRPDPDHTRQIDVSKLLSELEQITAISDRAASPRPFG